eukprot:TRINITY_DN7050_c0_g1_i10.p1 TRINITY_DN7050_c0_g1~~TRINITY_DN7050_c0_g1_i10.p1  ORF type:complete len:213 (-),score=17.85 TRINITY_DN7050_c0_g1_i10:925-1563(-)
MCIPHCTIMIGNFRVNGTTQTLSNPPNVTPTTESVQTNITELTSTTPSIIIAPTTPEIFSSPPNVTETVQTDTTEPPSTTPSTGIVPTTTEAFLNPTNITATESVQIDININASSLPTTPSIIVPTTTETFSNPLNLTSTTTETVQTDKTEPSSLPVIPSPTINPDNVTNTVENSNQSYSMKGIAVLVSQNGSSVSGTIIFEQLVNSSNSQV